jgi:hypothetical protein
MSDGKKGNVGSISTMNLGVQSAKASVLNYVASVDGKKRGRKKINE